jgi:antitoxin PrlF
MTDEAACTSCASDADPSQAASDKECCALEAVVSVDDRGQLVLPKDLRTRAGIRAGDRLAVMSYRGDDGEICCITLVKTGAVAGAVQSVIAPALGREG